MQLESKIIYKDKSLTVIRLKSRMFYIYMRLKHGFDFYLKLKLNICGVNHVREKK